MNDEISLLAYLGTTLMSMINYRRERRRSKSASSADVDGNTTM